MSHSLNAIEGIICYAILYTVICSNSNLQVHYTMQFPIIVIYYINKQ